MDEIYGESIINMAGILFSYNISEQGLETVDEGKLVPIGVQYIEL